MQTQMTLTLASLVVALALVLSVQDDAPAARRDDATREP
mgnify:CR=1 FL=1